jgi:hypothetical protein
MGTIISSSGLRVHNLCMDLFIAYYRVAFEKLFIDDWKLQKY